MSTQTNERIPRLTLGWRLQMALGEESSQTMADYLGVSRATISRWMHDKGAPPKKAYLAQWALRTGVPVEWLENGTEPSDGGDGGGNMAPSTATSSLSSGPPTSSYAGLRLANAA